MYLEHIGRKQGKINWMFAVAELKKYPFPQPVEVIEDFETTQRGWRPNKRLLDSPGTIKQVPALQCLLTKM